MNKTILEVSNVTKKVTSPEGELTIVNDISLSLEEGVFASILGPSGSGKSTLAAKIASYLSDKRSSKSINFIDVNNWINSCNDKDRSSYHSYEPFLTKDIIIITNNKLIQNEHIIKYNYADINSDFDLTNIDELNFTEYIIYYFYENCIYCYVINFIILPYFDERILQKKTFLHYKKIKINTFYEHNITQINGINF